MNCSNHRFSWRSIVAALFAILTSAGSCTAQFLPNEDPSSSYDPAPQRLVWPGVAVIIVIAIFITAALAGPLIRANADESTDSASPSQEGSD